MNTENREERFIVASSDVLHPKTRELLVSEFEIVSSAQCSLLKKDFKIDCVMGLSCRTLEDAVRIQRKWIKEKAKLF